MRKDWEYKKLGEVCDILDSQRKPVTKKDRKKGIYPYYGATGIQDFVDNYIFDGRYVLVGEDGAKWSANEKCAYIIEGKTWINNHAHVLSTKNMVIDSFLTYYLNFSDLDSYISGAIIRKLTQSSLKSIPIPLPPKPTQLAIVAELDKINELIQLKKQQLEDYDQLAQSIFYEMFGDPVENEKGWEVKKLREIALEKMSYGSGASAVPYNQKIRYIRITDIDELGCLKKDIVSPNICEDKYLLSDGDILFARSGATVGKTFLFKSTYGSCIYAGYLIRLRPNTQIVIPEYVYHYTKTHYYRSFIESNQRVVAQPNINAQQYSSLKLPLPPLPLQQQFAARIEAIERQKQQVSETIKDLETLLASRMQYWFD